MLDERLATISLEGLGMKKDNEKVSRREVIKKAAFVAPIVLSLPAAAAFASNGSGRGWHGHGGNGRGNGRRDRDGWGRR